MIKKIIFILLGIFSLSNSVNAAVITNPYGHVIKITNYEYSNVVYDITFHVGSFTSIFGEIPDLDRTPNFLGDSSGALLSTGFISDILNSGPFYVVSDSSGFVAHSIVIPHTLGGSPFLPFESSYTSHWTYFGEADVYSPYTEWKAIGTTLLGNVSSIHLGRYGPISYAIFTPTSVPIPTAVWLLTPALLGLLGFKRKH